MILDPFPKTRSAFSLVPLGTSHPNLLLTIQCDFPGCFRSFRNKLGLSTHLLTHKEKPPISRMWLAKSTRLRLGTKKSNLIRISTLMLVQSRLKNSLPMARLKRHHRRHLLRHSQVITSTPSSHYLKYSQASSHTIRGSTLMLVQTQLKNSPYKRKTAL
jgi:hypothetical protein